MICPYCNKEAEWVENKKIYGKNFGKSYMAWFCKECDAYVGCHNNTKRPLGTMANKELRTARIQAHEVINPLYENGKRSRNYVYKVLSDAFGEVIHIGESDIQKCEEIIKTAKLIFKS